MTTRLTVTVPDELGAYIREQVDAGKYDSVSAFVTQAAQSMRDFEPLDLLIASMIAETGEPDEQARNWAEHAMAVASRAARADDADGKGRAAWPSPPQSSFSMRARSSASSERNAP